MPGSPILELAPAKINLALHVTGRRENGYHDLDMLVAFADGIGDRLSVEPASSDSFAITGPMAVHLSADGDNLVIRARDGFRALTGWIEPVAVTLEKHLPVASGIGGGSADAAATLRALCRLSGHDPASLADLALSLGADVPMCLVGRPAHISGIGETIQPVASGHRYGLLLVNPGIAVSTPSVFRTLERRDNPPLPDLPTDLSAEAFAAYLAANTRNDLEPPARHLAPVISDVLAELDGLAGIRLARMSGSGATCFGLFDDAEHAEAAGDIVHLSHPDWWVASGLTSF
jgi:4-diphosphocytidyl-2-C-methyl-D-erythritol kinase